jgi:hypothetical protein
MGYTSYWSATAAPVPAEAFGRLASDCREVIFPAAAHLGIALASGDGTGEPEVTEGQIIFNGSEVNDGDHETFYLLAGELPGFSFCKTARKPYDLVVSVVLLRAAHHYGAAIDIASDGRWDGDDEWVPPRAWYRSLFGEVPTSPWKGE